MSTAHDTTRRVAAQVRGELVERVVGAPGMTARPDSGRHMTGHSAGTAAPEVSDSTLPLSDATDTQSAAFRPSARRASRPRQRFAPVAGIPARLLTVAEAATYLRVSPWTVRDLTWKGRLRVVRLGAALRFDLRDLDRLIDAAKE